MTSIGASVRLPPGPSLWLLSPRDEKGTAHQRSETSVYAQDPWCAALDRLAYQARFDHLQSSVVVKDGPSSKRRLVDWGPR